MSLYDREPLYVISVAARLLEMHAQTLRKYEREGFIEPSRTRGRLRLYSAEDIERLRQIKYLVEQRGLNLAGVQLALALSQRLSELPGLVREAGTVEEAAARCERELGEVLRALGFTPEWASGERDGSNGDGQRPREARQAGEPRATREASVERQERARTARPAQAAGRRGY